MVEVVRLSTRVYRSPRWLYAVGCIIAGLFYFAFWRREKWGSHGYVRVHASTLAFFTFDTMFQSADLLLFTSGTVEGFHYDLYI